MKHWVRYSAPHKLEEVGHSCHLSTWEAKDKKTDVGSRPAWASVRLPFLYASTVWRVVPLLPLHKRECRDTGRESYRIQAYDPHNRSLPLYFLGYIHSQYRFHFPTGKNVPCLGLERQWLSRAWGSLGLLRLPAWFVVMLTTAALRGSGLRLDTPLTASIQKE